MKERSTANGINDIGDIVGSRSGQLNQPSGGPLTRNIVSVPRQYGPDWLLTFPPKFQYRVVSCSPTQMRSNSSAST
jgi:hypothetical protein